VRATPRLLKDVIWEKQEIYTLVWSGGRLILCPRDSSSNLFWTLCVLVTAAFDIRVLRNASTVSSAC